jgi:DNA-binding SARP family transcriptional activator
MEFRILGPLGVRHAGRPVALGGPRQRAVLAALVARANEPASVPYLTDSIWDTPPVAPESNLRTYIAGLRRCFADAGADPASLRTEANTYVLDVDPHDVDVHQFAHWSALGDRALEQGDHQAAADHFADALALWHGDPFEGLTVGPLLRAELARLQDRWLTVHERHAHTMIELGAHDDVLADLRRLVGEHPLRERLWVLLLLAQYRAGRPAEALATYQDARRVLSDELGVDPGAELRDLHERILRGTVAPAGTGQPGFTPVTPRQLPAVPRLFTGRTPELARITEIAAAGPPSGIAVIGGFGGTGKTSLALYWAHQNLDRFPEGQLYVNLRGFDPTAAPIPPLSALQGFLEALGVPPTAIPAELDGCAALYRSLIAGRRMLVVLDNARDAEHVQPLLPGGDTCFALVTSRHQLTGLITAHGAQLVALDVFDTPEAREFLALTLGKERLAAEPDATTELLRHCAGLPLALAIIAARAAVNPGFPLSTLADELRDAAVRLDAFDGGELSANLSATFTWSQHALPAPAVTAFAQLGLAPGPDTSLEAAANLVGLATSRTRIVLRQLETAHLLQQHAPNRYRMHDLVRLHAADLAHRTLDDEPQRRVIDFYLHTAAEGDRLLSPLRAPIELDPPTPGCHPQELADETAAMAWFETEHHNAVAAQRVAFDRGWHTRAWQLAWVLSTFYGRRGHLNDSLETWRVGLTAAQRDDDLAATALAHRFIGRALGRTGQYPEMVDHLQKALGLLRHTGDLFGQAHAHRSLAWIRLQQGHEQRALVHAVRALRLYQRLGADVWVAEARSLAGWHYARVGDYDRARDYCEEALRQHRQHDHREAEANTLDSLGHIARNTGNTTRAIEYYDAALAIQRELGDATQEATTLENLAETHTAAGQLDEARKAWQQALDVYRTQRRTDDATRAEAAIAQLGE